MANVKVKIEKLDGTFMELAAQYVNSISKTTQTASDPATPVYSAIPQKGTILLQDKEQTIMNEVLNNTVDLNSAKIKIEIDGVSVFDGISKSGNYNYDNKTVNIEITDKLSLWDIIQYSGYPIVARYTSWYELLLHILSNCGYMEEEVEEMCSEQYDSTQTVKDFLLNISVPIAYLKADTLRNSVDKILTLSFMHAIVDENGAIKFVCYLPTNRTSMPLDTLIISDAITIPTSAQYGEVKIDLCSMEKYNGITGKLCNIEIATGEITQYPNGGGSETYSQAIDDNSENPNNYTQITKTNVSGNYTSQTTYIEIPITVSSSIHDKCTQLTATATNFRRKLGVGNVYEEQKTIPGTIIQSRLSDEAAELAEEYGCYLYVDPNNNTQWYLYLSIKSLFGTNNSLTLTRYKTKNFSISFSGAVPDITYKSFSMGLSNLYEFKENELLQYGTSMLNMSGGIENETNGFLSYLNYVITNNFGSGILNGKLTIACQDYYRYYSPLVKAKDWSNREIISVGDIIYIAKNSKGDSILTYSDNSPYLWIVTSATLRKKACPYLDIEFQEVGLFNTNARPGRTWAISSIALPLGVSISYRKNIVSFSSPNLSVKEGEAIKLNYARQNYTLNSMTVYRNGKQICYATKMPCYVTVTGYITVSVSATGGITP